MAVKGLSGWKGSWKVCGPSSRLKEGVSLRSDQVAPGFIYFGSGFENQGEETSKDKDCKALGQQFPILDCTHEENVFSYIHFLIFWASVCPLFLVLTPCTAVSITSESSQYIYPDISIALDCLEDYSVCTAVVLLDFISEISFSRRCSSGCNMILESWHIRYATCSISTKYIWTNRNMYFWQYCHLKHKAKVWGLMHLH